MSVARLFFEPSLWIIEQSSELLVDSALIAGLKRKKRTKFPTSEDS